MILNRAMRTMIVTNKYIEKIMLFIAGDIIKKEKCDCSDNPLNKLNDQENKWWTEDWYLAWEKLARNK